MLWSTCSAIHIPYQSGTYHIPHFIYPPQPSISHLIPHYMLGLKSNARVNIERYMSLRIETLQNNFSSIIGLKLLIKFITKTSTYNSAPSPPLLCHQDLTQYCTLIIPDFCTQTIYPRSQPNYSTSPITFIYPTPDIYPLLLYSIHLTPPIHLSLIYPSNTCHPFLNISHPILPLIYTTCTILTQSIHL